MCEPMSVYTKLLSLHGITFQIFKLYFTAMSVAPKKILETNFIEYNLQQAHGTDMDRLRKQKHFLNKITICSSVKNLKLN